MIGICIRGVRTVSGVCGLSTALFGGPREGSAFSREKPLSIIGNVTHYVIEIYWVKRRLNVDDLRFNKCKNDYAITKTHA